MAEEEKTERTPEEKTLLIKKALLGIIIVLMALYMALWFMDMGTSVWVGIISGLLLLLLLILALVTKYRK
jgi:hypothetical protein